MKKLFPRIVIFLAGLFFLLEFVLPDPLPGTTQRNPLSACYGTVTNVLMVLGGMAFFLGPINLTRSELMEVVRKGKDWVGSLVFLIGLVAGILATAARSDNPTGDFERTMTIAYDAIFYGVGLAFYMTSMALVSFYLVSAAHRAFLLNSVESSLMMASATIVMLGLTPAGDFLNGLLPSSLQVGAAAQWVLSVPNTAVQKAVLFGACGGAFAAAMRNWLSLERSSE
jgi:hypothetical protein